MRNDSIRKIARPWTWLLAAAIAFVAMPRLGLAQSPLPLPSFDMERFQLDPGGVDSLIIGTGKLLKKGDVRFSAAFHYQRSPLVVELGGNQTGRLVGDRLGLHVVGAFAVHSRIELGVRLPPLFTQMGQDLTAQGVQVPASPGIGASFVTSRFGILEAKEGHKAPVDLAVELGLGIPTGTPKSISLSGGVIFAPKLMVGRRLGSFVLATELGAQIMETVSFFGSDVGSFFSGGASIGVATKDRRLRGEVSWKGAFQFSPSSIASEILGAVRFELSKAVHLFAIAGPGFGGYPGTPVFRTLVGVEFLRPPAEESARVTADDTIKERWATR